MSTDPKISIQKNIPLPVPPPPAYKIELNFTEREALAFRAMLEHIGGPPESSFRGFLDKLRESLDSVGITTESGFMDNRGHNSSIYFDRWPKKYRLPGE